MKTLKPTLIAAAVSLALSSFGAAWAQEGDASTQDV